MCVLSSKGGELSLGCFWNLCNSKTEGSRVQRTMNQCGVMVRLHKVKDCSGNWRGLGVTFLGVKEIRGEGGIWSRRISPIGWYVTPWGNMTPALTLKSI